MPFPSEHRARQKPPGDFVQFRRAPIDQAPEGVEGIFGVRGDETMELVEVVFNADTWAPATAKRWLEDRGLASAGFQVAQVTAVETIVMQQDGGGFADKRVNAVRFDRLPADGVRTGQTVRRWDTTPLEKPEKTDLGMRAQGMITRSGVFVYQLRDGQKIRELRHPDEVFDAESLRSFTLVPLTNDHPPDNLTTDTIKEHQVGSIGTPQQVGDHLRADILITDDKAIAAVEGGKSELSCGYTCQVLAHSGVYTDSAGVDHRFDAVQSKIRGNHVAIVDQGRAGPSAAIRVDEADGFAERERKDEDMDLVEVKIGDTVYKVPKAVADALKAKGDQEGEPPKDPEDKPKDTAGSEEDEPKGDSAKLIARLVAESQAKDGKIAALEAEKKGDSAKAKADADRQQINDRINLLAQAQPILGVKLDDLHAKSDDDIMRAVVAKKAPSVKLDGKSADYVRGIFEHVTATESKTDTAASLNSLVGGAREADATSASDAQKRNDQARDQMVTDMTLAWMPEDDRKAYLERQKARS